MEEITLATKVDKNINVVILLLVAVLVMKDNY